MIVPVVIADDIDIDRASMIEQSISYQSPCIAVTVNVSFAKLN